MPNTKRGFGSVGLILIILIILGGGAYLWSQKTAPPNVPADNSFKTLPATITNTSTWKTYRDEKYGFEFQYPEEWVSIYSGCIESPDNIYQELEPNELDIRKKLIHGAGFCFYMGPFGYGTENIDDLREFNKLGRGGPKFINERVVNLGILSGLVYDFSDFDGVNGYAMQFLKSGNKFEMAFRYKDLNGKMLFDQILSTFRFTK